jgi:hypothetical protein
MLKDTWIETCEYLLQINADNIHMDFIKALAEHEIHPGGPYRQIEGSKVDPEDNLAIFFLLRNYEISLTPLNEYISEHFPDVKQESNAIHSIEDSYISKVKKKFEKELNKLPKHISNYWKKLKNNTFTNEVILLPTLFDIPKKDHAMLSIISIYGWLYFSILDQLVDEKDFPKELQVSKDYLLIKYLQKLKQVDGNFDEKIIIDAIEVNIEELENGVTEETVIIRSKPYYMSLYVYWNGKKKDVYNQLDSYLLAKQYNDDLHDFIDDMDNNRNTLVTNKIDRSKDIHKQYIDKVLPNSINRVKELLGTVTLKNFIFAENLRRGVKEYEVIKDQYNNLYN